MHGSNGAYQMGHTQPSTAVLKAVGLSAQNACGESPVFHTLSIAFKHFPPNSARNWLHHWRGTLFFLCLILYMMSELVLLMLVLWSWNWWWRVYLIVWILMRRLYFVRPEWLEWMKKKHCMDKLIVILLYKWSIKYNTNGRVIEQE